jgi:DNA-directed RNA polymerase specialized sigma24 family protein
LRAFVNQLAADAGGVVMTLDDANEPIAKEAKELLALDSALEELAQVSPRQALLVEARFFGGLDMEEVAEFLNVSESTLLRDWRAARAWLAQELRRSR